MYELGGQFVNQVANNCILVGMHLLLMVSQVSGHPDGLCSLFMLA